MFNIIIPTINRVDLLLPLIGRLDYQINDPRIYKLFIIDNGKQGLQTIHPKIIIQNMPTNLGVSASWNLGLKQSFSNPDISHVIALNDDIMLGHDQLNKMLTTIENNTDSWMLVGPYYWSVWSMSREGAEVMQYEPGKYFDEHFFPAYFEDNDFYRRMYLINPTKYVPNVSSFAPETAINSGSLSKDRSLNNRFDENKRYYISKWGGEPHQEKYLTPFNR